MIVRFVDIGGIDDHHCLNFLFITLLTIVVYKRLQISICGGSRGSDHCACSTGSDAYFFFRIPPPRTFLPVLFQKSRRLKLDISGVHS